MAKKESLDPPVLAGIMPPEFHADFAKPDVTPGGVKIWAYTDQRDPAGGTFTRIPAAILSMPVTAFDAFLADCLRIRARLLHLDGHAVAIEAGAEN